MTSVLTHCERMHSDTKTKSSNFALVERYHNMLKSLNDGEDCNDVMMGTLDQEVPVSSDCGEKVKTEMEEKEEPEVVPDTPTILCDLSYYLPAEAILHPVHESRDKNKTTSSNSNSINTTSYSLHSNSSNCNIPTPVYKECDRVTPKSTANTSSIKAPNCFNFKQSSTKISPFLNYSQSASSSPKQQQQYSSSSSLSSSLSSLSSSSSQSQLWSMSSSSISSASSPPHQWQQAPQHNFSSSPLSNSSPVFTTLSPSSLSSYSSSPSLSSSPLLSSTSTSPRSFTETKPMSFVSEQIGSGCTVFTGVPNFLSGDCYNVNTCAETEVMAPSRNQEESLEYTDLDKMTEVSLYDDLTSIGGKDHPHHQPLKPSMPSSVDESGGAPYEEMVDLMTDAIEIDRKELNLPHNPQYWNAHDVSRWVRWVCRRNGVPDVSNRPESYTGAALCSWSLDTFKSFYGSSGFSVFQELELWKAAYMYNNSAHDIQAPFMESSRMFSPSTSPAPSHASSNYDSHHLVSSSTDNSEDDVFYLDTDIKMEMSSETKPHIANTSTALKFKCHPFKPRLGRGHKKAITLWQFLLELLTGEEDHSDCIKWLNKEKRIFKIEDSKKVSGLWGKVKSRPAMNYDKMSRSMRQYYKKGIIRKPEETKRLVYQFCPGVC